MNERAPKLTRTRTFWWSEKNKSYILHLNRLDSAYLRAGIGKLRAVIFSHLHLEINILLLLLLLLLLLSLLL